MDIAMCLKLWHQPEATIYLCFLLNSVMLGGSHFVNICFITCLIEITRKTLCITMLYLVVLTTRCGAVKSARQ